jgi:hypothetical protein
MSGAPDVSHILKFVSPATDNKAGLVYFRGKMNALAKHLGIARASSTSQLIMPSVRIDDSPGAKTQVLQAIALKYPTDAAFIAASEEFCSKTKKVTINNVTEHFSLQRVVAGDYKAAMDRARLAKQNKRQSTRVVAGSADDISKTAGSADNVSKGAASADNVRKSAVSADVSKGAAIADDVRKGAAFADVSKEADLEPRFFTTIAAPPPWASMFDDEVHAYNVSISMEWLQQQEQQQWRARQEKRVVAEVMPEVAEVMPEAAEVMPEVMPEAAEVMPEVMPEAAEVMPDAAEVMPDAADKPVPQRKRARATTPISKRTTPVHMTTPFATTAATPFSTTTTEMAMGEREEEDEFVILKAEYYDMNDGTRDSADSGNIRDAGDSADSGAFSDSDEAHDAGDSADSGAFRDSDADEDEDEDDITGIIKRKLQYWKRPRRSM